MAAPQQPVYPLFWVPLGGGSEEIREVQIMNLITLRPPRQAKYPPTMRGHWVDANAVVQTSPDADIQIVAAGPSPKGSGILVRVFAPGEVGLRRAKLEAVLCAMACMHNIALHHRDYDTLDPSPASVTLLREAADALGAPFDLTAAVLVACFLFPPDLLPDTSPYLCSVLHDGTTYHVPREMVGIAEVQALDTLFEVTKKICPFVRRGPLCDVANALRASLHPPVRTMFYTWKRHLGQYNVYLKEAVAGMRNNQNVLQQVVGTPRANVLLQMAASVGLVEEATFLIDNDATLQQPGILNEALVMASLNGAECTGGAAMVGLLMSKGATATATHAGRTPFMLACQVGNVDMACAIWGRGTTGVNARDDDGKTALMIAALYGRRRMLVWLLQHAKADHTLFDPQGTTALAFAEWGYWRGCVKTIQVCFCFRTLASCLGKRILTMSFNDRSGTGSTP